MAQKMKLSTKSTTKRAVNHRFGGRATAKGVNYEVEIASTVVPVRLPSSTHPTFIAIPGMEFCEFTIVAKLRGNENR